MYIQSVCLSVCLVNHIIQSSVHYNTHFSIGSYVHSMYILYCPLYTLMWPGGAVGEACTVNLVVGRSSPGCVKLKKICQKAFNSKISGSFGSRPNLESLGYHKNIVCMLKIYPNPLHIGQCVKAARCCQPGHVAQCIVLYYTGSFSNSRY